MTRPRCKYVGGERPCTHLVYPGDDRCRRHILRDAGWSRRQRGRGGLFECWLPPDDVSIAYPRYGLTFEAAWDKYRRLNSNTLTV